MLAKKNINKFLFITLDIVIFIILILNIFDSIVVKVIEGVQLYNNREYTYHIIKDFFISILTILSPLRLLANILYITEKTVPVIIKILDIIMNMIYIILIFLLILSFGITVYILIPHSIYSNEIIDNLLKFIQQFIFSRYEIHVQQEKMIISPMILSLVLMFWPDKINFIYSFQRMSIFRRLLLFIFYIPFKTIDKIRMKIEKDELASLLYDQFKNYVLLLPDEASVIINDLITVKDFTSND